MLYKLLSKLSTTSAQADGKTFRRSWGFLLNRLTVRYTCAASNAAVERAEIDEIIQSVSEIR
jgi:hypothetical protein